MKTPANRLVGRVVVVHSEVTQPCGLQALRVASTASRAPIRVAGADPVRTISVAEQPA